MSYNNMDMSAASLSRIELEVVLSGEDFEPHDFITTFHGKIIGYSDDEVGDSDDNGTGEEEEIDLGTVRVHIVELDRARDERQSLFEVMDSLDADTCDCFEQLFEVETEEWKPAVEQLLHEDRMFYPNLMLIDRLQLNPEYRGQGIGKQVALRLIQKLGYTSGVIACNPYPLQFTGINAREKPLRGIKAARKRVQLFWEGVGFVRVPGAHYYIWPD